MDVLGLPDAGRHILMTAALDSPDRALSAWRTWERSGAGAQGDPVAQRWLPLIGWNLQHAPLDENTRTLFSDARRGMWASNVRIMDAARPALEALTANGVGTILLKGAALTLTAYDAPGLRALGDVDVLIDPAEADTAQRVLADLGWRPHRKANARDRLLVHALDLRKPPHGALDLHWYLLAECCWPSVDRGLWQRARPLASDGLAALALSPADQLLHVCLHGLRWSPVHGGHWVADALQLIARAEAGVDWDVVVEESQRRRMGLQMAEALRVVQRWRRPAVPDSVVQALADQPVSWRERWECRLKGRPVVSPAGMFVLWTGWRRTKRAAEAEGDAALPWFRYLAAELGVNSSAALVPRFAMHAWNGAMRIWRRGPRRGATTRVRWPTRGSR